MPPDGQEDACTEKGTLRCFGPAQKVSQLCEAGNWVTASICKSNENCDQSNGACAPILAECAAKIGGRLYCGPDDKVFECGPDLVSTEEAEQCNGKCTDSESSASCAPVTCGDGKVQAPEECDDDNDDQTDGCTNACKKPTCGDGSTWKGHEDCDDGNTKDDDACTSTCKTAACGDGFVWTGHETCDDKNRVNTDTCSNVCQKAVCGDGIVQTGKDECDDKNAIAGDGCSKTCTVEPVQIVAMHTLICALGSNGSIRCFYPSEPNWGYLSIGLGAGEKATGIAGTADHLCAVVNGAARCWGANLAGQLGVGDKVGRDLTGPVANIDLGPGAVVTGVAAGASHSCAALKDGRVKCWGNNADGQLGIVKDSNNLAIGDAPGEMGAALSALPGAFMGVTDIVAADRYSCARRTDMSVQCWGVGAGGSYTTGSKLNLGTLLTVKQLSVGGVHACAILTDNSLKCWGTNTQGQLGQDDTASRSNNETMGDSLLPINLGTGKTAVSVTATDSQATCAVLNDGTAKCWGSNKDGRLGTGDAINRGNKPGDMAALKPLTFPAGRTARQMALSRGTFCALLDDGSIACWGAVFGPAYNVLGDQPNEMGDKLPILTLKF